MAGILIPPWYQVSWASPEMLGIAVYFMGCFTAITAFTAFKAAGQTYKVLRRKRGRKPSTYIVMVWLDWLVNILMGRPVLAVDQQHDRAQNGSFWLFISLVCLFVLEVQLIAQILINRISLLMIDRRRVARVKWRVASALMLICVGVSAVWIPAHLQTSQTFIRINNVWDRIEKSLILVMDAGLNIYFLWLVKSTLLDYGLAKYRTLFRFNLVAVIVSVSLDAINIGVMSIQYGWIYMIFQPMAYMIKLFIELNMADLVCSIVLDPDKRSRPWPSSRGPAAGQEPPGDCFPDRWDDDGPFGQSPQPSLMTPARHLAAAEPATTTTATATPDATVAPSIATPLELQRLAAPSTPHPASPGAGDEQTLISPVLAQPREKPSGEEGRGGDGYGRVRAEWALEEGGLRWNQSKGG